MSYNPGNDVGLTKEMTQIREVYLAGPFFTNEQLNEIVIIEELLKNSGFSYFSPRKECRYNAGDPEIVADRAFYLNCWHISTCKFVVASLTWKDTGTAWELGYAHAIKKPRLGVTSLMSIGFNLMVVRTVNALISLPNLEPSLESIGLDIKDRGRGILPSIVAVNDDLSWKGMIE
jgi:hypothetical protein